MAYIDNWLIHYGQNPYLLITRDTFIHERCAYLVALLKESRHSALRVLDVGCGSGLALFYLDRFCRDKVASYVGIDRDTARLTARWDFIGLPHRYDQIDLDTQWMCGEFDMIWCSEVIEHLLDDERLFARLISHLSPAGMLTITTPSAPFVKRIGEALPSFARVSPIQDGGHVRIGYTLDDFRIMAHRHGCSVSSTAWLSPCSVADLKPHGKSLLPIQFVIRYLMRPKDTVILDGAPDLYAIAFSTMAVSFIRHHQPD